MQHPVLLLHDFLLIDRSALEETFQYFSPPPSLPMPLPSLLLPGIVLPSDILPEAVAAGSVV